MESNSSLAQGGIAAVLRPPDNFQNHINDTLEAGQGLSETQVVKTLVRHGEEEINWLIDQGVEFTKNQDEIDLTREGGHSIRRIVHAEDITGHEVQKILIERAIHHPNIQINENIIGIDLIIKNQECVGLKALDIEQSSLIEFYSNMTVIATGGAGQLYAKTSNPVIATGDGIAMAWRAGATLRDLEFIQFHPSILDLGESPYFLISEAVRGEGGILLNSEKKVFMNKYHPLQDLAPRDIVSRAIVEEQKKGQVYIDIRIRGKEYLVGRFPGIFNECKLRGFLMYKDIIPVSPAAHYFCGGVKTNVFGETNIPRLLVLGESASTGVHGANRLASNSTLECLVFSHLASNKIKGASFFPIRKEVKNVSITSPETRDKLLIQDIMWKDVGIIRNNVGLREAVNMLNQLYKYSSSLDMNNLSINAIESRNLLCVARQVSKAALFRKESRGTHYSNDYPNRVDKTWLKHIEINGERMVKRDHN